MVDAACEARREGFTSTMHHRFCERMWHLCHSDGPTIRHVLTGEFMSLVLFKDVFDRRTSSGQSVCPVATARITTVSGTQVIRSSSIIQCQVALLICPKSDYWRAGSPVVDDLPRSILCTAMPVVERHNQFVRRGFAMQKVHLAISVWLN